jgi:hypothetical protein
MDASGHDLSARKVFLKAVDLVMNDLTDRDAARGQKIRVAAIHSDWSEDKS